MTSAVDLFQESIEVLENYGHYIVNDSDTQPEEIEELTSLMKCFCESKEKYELAQNVFNDLLQEVESSSEKLNSKEIIRNYRKEISESHDTENETYVQFKQLFSNINKQSALNDSDITAVSESINTIDPITKLPFTDPVKNVICGHSYEKSAIFELLKKRHVKCPVAGCVEAENVKKSDLIPDVALKKYMESLNNT